MDEMCPPPFSVLFLARYRLPSSSKKPFLTLDTHTHTHKSPSYLLVTLVLYNTYVWRKILQVFRILCFVFRAPKLIFRTDFHLLYRIYSNSSGVPQLISKNWIRLRFHKFCITSARSRALALIRYWPSVNHWCRNQFQLRTTKIIWFYCNSTIKLQ